MRVIRIDLSSTPAGLVNQTVSELWRALVTQVVVASAAERYRVSLVLLMTSQNALIKREREYIFC